MGSLSQGLLAFEYEADRSESGLTNLAGAGAYLELIEGAGVGEAIDREVGLRRVGQGWTDRHISQRTNRRSRKSGLFVR